MIAIVSLFGRSRLYDDIGRGGLSIGEDRDMRPRGAQAPAAGVTRAERDAEIRQMLEARNARRAAQGRETVDVEAELAELTQAGGGIGSGDPRGGPRARARPQLAPDRPRPQPLDEDAEVARQLRDLPGDPG